MAIARSSRRRDKVQVMADARRLLRLPMESQRGCLRRFEHRVHTAISHSLEHCSQAFGVGFLVYCREAIPEERTFLSSRQQGIESPGGAVAEKTARCLLRQTMTAP